MASCLVATEQNGSLHATSCGQSLFIKGGKTLHRIRNLPTRSASNNGMSSNGITQPRPLIICGPSGSGKSTLLKLLLAEFRDCFGFSVSHTTRKPRTGEIDGRDYYFVERQEMEESIKRGDFIEFAEFSGNLYGTSKKAVQRIQDQGRICILDIEMEGVKKIKQTNLNPYYVFINPPSISVLEARLRGRNTDSEESIRKRLEKAEEEIKFGNIPGNFNLVLVNDDVNETYKNLRNFLLKDLEGLQKMKKK